MRMAEACRLCGAYEPQLQKRGDWRANGQLEDERHFTGSDPCFAARAELLSAAAVPGCSGTGGSGGVPDRSPTVALGTRHTPAWSRIFSGLPGDALPGAPKQDSHRVAGTGDSGCGPSPSLSASYRERSCGHFDRRETMKTWLSVLAGLVVAVLVALGWRYFGGSTVPAGQPALMKLTAGNFDELRAAFDAARGKVRIVLLLSPT